MKGFLTFIVVLLLLGLGVGSYFAFGNYSEGMRSGILMKISKKGVIFKTNEGQLNIGGFDQTSDVGVSNVWEFSVTDEAVLVEIEDAIDKSQRVKMFYREKFIKLPWRGETKYFVYELEELGEI